MLFTAKFISILFLLWICTFVTGNKKVLIICMSLIAWIVIHYFIGSPGIFNPYSQEFLEQFYDKDLDRYYNH